jgi:hypothetical protein
MGPIVGDGTLEGVDRGEKQGEERAWSKLIPARGRDLEGSLEAGHQLGQHPTGRDRRRRSSSDQAALMAKVEQSAPDEPNNAVIRDGSTSSGIALL